MHTNQLFFGNELRRTATKWSYMFYRAAIPKCWTLKMFPPTTRIQSYEIELMTLERTWNPRRHSTRPCTARRSLQSLLFAITNLCNQATQCLSSQIVLSKSQAVQTVRVNSDNNMTMDAGWENKNHDTNEIEQSFTFLLFTGSKQILSFAWKLTLPLLSA